MAFLDEDDSFPPVATEPEDHRPPPDRQRVFMVRRLGAVAVGILVLILLVLGVRGCLNARKERAFENYARDLTAVVQESQQQSETFFGRFEGDENLTELNFETEVRADRSNAEQLVSRAESLDPPGELDGAQDNVVEAFELRRDGLAAIADNIGAALGDENTTEATDEIVVHMEDFLASDVVYRQARDEINTVLDEEDIGEKVPKSEFFPRDDDGNPDPEWFDRVTVSENLAGISGGGDGGGGGVHGLGVATVLIGDTELLAESANTVPLEGTPEVEVQVENQGDSEESDIPVTVSIEGTDESVEGDATLDRIDSGETESVTVPLDPAPSSGTSGTLEAFVEPVPDEQFAENNEFVADVTFE
ncbi:MAG TPA: CARDB domain-containing protein [Solirubrobacterales bacterium]|nr:CARDB domain-containing protein [Solirubrobacterales bacterium]